MEIKVTGDYRDIANAAWISTTDEIKTKSRTDENAKKVVEFLIENHHTSPLESVTISLVMDLKKDLEKYSDESPERKIIFQNLMKTVSFARSFEIYSKSNFAKVFDSIDKKYLTIDLLNFIKITKKKNLFTETPWLMFAEERPELSEMVSKFNPLGEKILTFDNVSERLGKHDMKVELVSFHKAPGTLVGDFGRRLDRATWRVKTPLSIAVQMLRHRSGSFNMVSGRYKTIEQELISATKDCMDIVDHMSIQLGPCRPEEDLMGFLGDYLKTADNCIVEYEALMEEAKEAKKKNIITNEQYKRLREFARFILPEGRMTELYVTFYLDDFYNNYLPLRDSIHAQIEHIWVAQEMRKTLEEYLEKN